MAKCLTTKRIVWIKLDKHNSYAVFNEFNISYIKEMAKIYDEAKQ